MEEEERLMRKEEEADGDGPPVLVSAPLTLKVEVGKAIQEDIFLVSVPQRKNFFSSFKVSDEAFLPCFVSRLGTCQVGLLTFLSIHRLTRLKPHHKSHHKPHHKSPHSVSFNP